MDDSFSQTKAFNRYPTAAVTMKIELTIQSQTRLQVNFIQAVDIHGAGGNETDVHIMPEDGSLYMILQSSITIMKVPIASSDPFFLDIPFDKISDVKVQTSTLMASQEPGASENAFQLLLNMEIGARNHQLCVDAGEARTMLFTFNDITQANQVAIYIDDERAQRRTSRPKMSMSQPLNISQEIQASTSPEKPAEVGSPQAMETDEIEPGPSEASIAIPRGRQVPQRKSTRSTTGGSKRTKAEVATSGPRTRTAGLELGESIVEGNARTEAEQHHEDEAVIEPNSPTRPAAGNLSLLLLAALSPEPEGSIFRSVRKTRNGVPAVTKRSANIAAKPKAATSAKGKQPKQREPATKKTTKVRPQAVMKIATAAPEQSSKLAEDEIWDIPSDPAELKQTTTKSKKAKTVTATVNNATRKTPARPAKVQANKRRTRVVESESDSEPDGDQNDGNFKAGSARLLPSPSPRRSARLQASAIKKEQPAPVENSRTRVSNGKSRELELPSSPTRRSPRIRSSYASRRAGTVGQVIKSAEIKKKTTTAAAKKLESQQATRPATRGKKQQSPVASREGDETPSLIPLPQDESVETIEAFEEAVLDFQTELDIQTEPDIQKKEVVIKKEPGRKSKTPEQVNKQKIPQKRPISITSDSESEEDSEDDSAVEGIQVGAQQVRKMIPTTAAKDIQGNSRTTIRAYEKGACDEVSVVEDSHPTMVKDLYPAVEDSNALAKRNSTPEGVSDLTLVDNKSARKMAIISFDRSGPRNQGVRVGLRSGNGTPIVRSDPVQAREGSNAAGESQAVGEMGFQTQPTFRLPVYVQARETREPRIEKRVARDDVPEGEPVKRQRTSQSMSKDDGFVDIDSYPDTAGRVSRRVSQRSVHITDDGSPMRNDLDEVATAINTGFGVVEDDFLHQGSDDGLDDTVVQDVTAPHIEIASPKPKAPPNATKATQKKQRMIKPISPVRGSSRIATKLAQGITKPLQDRIVENPDGEDFAEQGLLPILRSSQVRSQTGNDERESNPADRASVPLLQSMGSRAHRASPEPPRRGTSSGRTQRSTAPMSSNHKPVPQPPGLDSQVISTYASEKEVEKAVARNRAEEKLNDPFSSSQKIDEVDQSFFMRRLATLMEERASNSAGGRVVEDADKTLVEDVPMEDIENSSSSDEELAVVVEEPEEEDHENAEEMEWEAALQPRLRDIFEVLGRITRRLVSHLVDSETAVDDVVEDFGRDGTRIVEEFEKCFRGQQSNVGGLQASMAKLKRLYVDTERQIVHDYNVLQTDIGSSLHDWNAGMLGKKTAIEQMERMMSA